MSKTKFTKGSWKKDNNGNIMANNKQIGVSGVSLALYSCDEVTANTDLISMAPEMYAELEKLSEIIDHYYGDAVGLHLALGMESVRSIDNLLLKARGESND